jgi:hypothetical protein
MIWEQTMTHFTRTLLGLRVTNCLEGGRASGDGDDSFRFLLPEDILGDISGRADWTQDLIDQGFRVRESVIGTRGNVWFAQ